MPVTVPVIKERKAQPYAAIRAAVPIPFGKYLGPMYKEVEAYLRSRGVTQTGPAIIRYLTTDMSRKLDIEVGFFVDEPLVGNGRVIVDVLPEGRYASMLYTGSYRGKGIYKATVEFIAWAVENKIDWNVTDKEGVEWWNGRVEIYLTDPAVEKDASKYQTELAFMVR